MPDYKFGDITKRVIRDMTGNKDYEFGDGSKALSAASQDAAEQAAKAVIDAGGTAVEAGAAAKKALDDSGYQFGDITKGAVKSFEETVREATGNEDCTWLRPQLLPYLSGATEPRARASLFAHAQTSSATSPRSLRRGSLARSRRGQPPPRRRLTSSHVDDRRRKVG